MNTNFLKRVFAHPLLLSAALAAMVGVAGPASLRAETPPEAVQAADEAPAPLSAEEMEILVARIALYPDELVAVISAASLYPLQVVEAERFLEDSKTKKDLKPKSTWDGSVISLLNYPEIVKMMSDDLDWTQLLGEAVINQQDDVLNAIQQLREQAVANGVIKTDEKVKVVTKVEKGRENIIIEPASTEVIYVPQYDPAMFYEPNYAYRPIAYYPTPYPYYWNPAATFFAGAVTGAIWAAAVDWDDGFWGGNWNNNYWHNWGGNNDIDIDFNCNKCIIGNDFSGKLNANNVDWSKIDRSKINIDKNQFNKLDNSKFKDGFKNNDQLKLGDKAGLKGDRPAARPAAGGAATKDIRKSTLDGLNKKPVNNFKPTDKMARPGDNGNLTVGDKMAKPGNNLKPGNGLTAGDKMAKPNLDRPVGKPRPGLDADNRPKTPSPLGEINRGRDAKMQSNRGNKAMGGGMNMPQFDGGGMSKMGNGGGGIPKMGGSAPKKKFIPKHDGQMGASGMGKGRARR